MLGQDVAITAPDGASFQSHIVGEASPPRPALMLFSTVFGVDGGLKEIARLWAERGYLVAAPDFFHRVHAGPCERSETGRLAARARWEALDIDAAMTDMVALKRYLTALPGCNGKVAALGICAGGELAFLSATRLGAHAAATYHGTRIERHLGEAQGLAVPVSLHYGDRDELIPLPTVEAIKQGLSGCRQADIHVYPGAAHGFSGAGKPSYHPFAALTSDRRVQEVFGPLRAAA